MINYTTVLTREDWQNLHGNEIFVQMLRNKVKVEIYKDTKTKDEDNDLLSVVLDYLKTVPEDLIYYDIEDVFGHKTIYVYFASPIDKENFYHYYNTIYSIEKVTK